MPMEIKRKRLDRDIWTDILDKDYHQCRVQTPFFTGYAALLDIRRVKKPAVWEFPEGSVVACDAGMQWVELLPEEGAHLITAMLGPDGEIREWYIDAIDGWGWDRDGVLWFDDLFLDLILRPGGQYCVDDRDELDAALADGTVTPEQHRRAVRTVEELAERYASNPSRLKRLTLDILHLLEGSRRTGDGIQRGGEL